MNKIFFHKWIQKYVTARKIENTNTKTGSEILGSAC